MTLETLKRKAIITHKVMTAARLDDKLRQELRQQLKIRKCIWQAIKKDVMPDIDYLEFSDIPLVITTGADGYWVDMRWPFAYPIRMRVIDGGLIFGYSVESFRNGGKFAVIGDELSTTFKTFLDALGAAVIT